VLLATSVAVLLLGLGFGAFGAYAYDTTTSVAPGCATRPFATSTPADFSVWRDRTQQALDTTPYRFADYQDVAFPARGDDVTIRAWYSPGHRGASTPTVILVHGKDSCRRDGNVLLPAGMLHRAGFGVLMVDLRNHGESDVTTGHWAAGSTEYADVLGAWDWLVSHGQAPARIGLFGASMGAASATIATAEEPRVRWSRFPRYSALGERRKPHTAAGTSPWRRMRSTGPPPLAM
jgi:pimeloyl-ACP methyl ester carboxylesterase